MDNSTADPKQAIVDKLKQSTNILVTVSSNPSVDQLAACLGLTIWLNKLDKHATAVFSGAVPSTLEFLKPEETLEKNTDSLRDFIIALDKSKADKLRYKVEDTVVKIFITPYRTSLSADDLEFSQGDFNVDMVIALGVHAQADLDTAITAHGRILHDATVATVTVGEQASELGSISWHDGQASSLSELVVDLGNALDQKELDGQIATALLTGIVAETVRFSNEKTTPQTMSISAQLMSAGANQQLVASKLEEPTVSHSDVVAAQASPDGTLEITHPAGEMLPDAQPQFPMPQPEQSTEPDFELPSVADEEPSIVDEFSQPAAAAEPATDSAQAPEVTDVKTNSSDLNEVDQPALADNTDDNTTDHSSRLVTEPPRLGGTLTANSRPDDVMLEPTSDPLSQKAATTEPPLLDRSSQPAEPPQPPDAPQPAAPSWMPPQPWMDQPTSDQQPPAGPTPPADNSQSGDDHAGETLADIEREVDSPHLQANPEADVDTETDAGATTAIGTDSQPPDLSMARNEVMKAIESNPDPNPEPVQALNAQPIDLNPPKDEPSEQPPAGPAAPSTAFDPKAFGITNDPDPDVNAASPASNSADNPGPDLTGPVDQPFTLPVPGALAPPPANPVPPTSTSDKPAPPPVPPPITNF